MMCLPTIGNREDNVLAENDRETCKEVNNVNTLNNISTYNIPENMARLRMR